MVGPWSIALLLTLQALACLAAVLLLLPRVRRLFGWGYLAYAAVVLAIPIIGTKDFMGTGRYVLAAFPVIAAAGDSLATRSAGGWARSRSRCCWCAAGGRSRRCTDGGSRSHDGAAGRERFEMLSVFFPMWNEELYIAPRGRGPPQEVCERLVAEGEIADYEIIVVDDASTDATGRLADELAAADPHVRVVHHPVNRKLGGSIKSGFDAAKGDLVLYTDADLPFEMIELVRAVRVLRTYEADIVSAYRLDRTGEGPRRAVYSWVYNWLIQRDVRHPAARHQLRVQAVPPPVLDHVRLASEGSFIDAELVIRAQRSGFSHRADRRRLLPADPRRLHAVLVRRHPDDAREMSALRGPPLDAQLPPGRRAAVTGRLLIVTADDLGLTDGVNRAVRRAHADGIVTATSLLAVGRAFDGAVTMLRATPDARRRRAPRAGRRGPAAAVRRARSPRSSTRAARFPLSYRTVVARGAAGRIDPDDVRREFGAQLERVRGIGLPVTHLDTHQHTHLWPAVGRVVIELAVRHAVGRGAAAVEQATGAGRGRRPRRWPVGWPGRSTSGAGPDGGYAGLDESGSLGLGALDRALAAAAAEGAASLEVNAHPGVADDPDAGRFDWGFQRARELAVLTDPRALRVVERHGFRPAPVRELAAVRP